MNSCPFLCRYLCVSTLGQAVRHWGPYSELTIEALLTQFSTWSTSTSAPRPTNNHSDQIHQDIINKVRLCSNKSDVWWPMRWRRMTADQGKKKRVTLFQLLTRLRENLTNQEVKLKQRDAYESDLSSPGKGKSHPSLWLWFGTQYLNNDLKFWEVNRVAKCQFFYTDHFCPTKFTPRKSA